MKANDVKYGRILVGLSRFASAMLSPLLIPTYGVLIALWCSYLSAYDMGLRVTVLLVVAGITCVLPMFFIATLHHFKLITDKLLVNRKERILPFIFTLLCHAAAAYYLYSRVHAPMWVVMFSAGGALAVLTSAVVNHWWKISAHMAGMAGIVALIYNMHMMMTEAFNLVWVLMVAVLICGMLGTARIVLGRHTLGQVLAGALNGFFCVSLLMQLFG
ncbi:MAG: hypothetical protein Q4B68_06715 [Bacteroidales bacterium]|nr:hypothetical protein [Bacteroidales bacterium]